MVRVNIDIISADNATGIIILEVKGNGTGPTPVSSPSGDTTINAKYSGVTVGQAQAHIVVIPVTQKQAPGSLILVNDAQNLVPEQTHITSTAERDFTITIYDQFEKVLDPIYNSTSKVVAESWTDVHSNIGNPFNGLFTGVADGVAIDPVTTQNSSTDTPAWSDSQITAWKSEQFMFPTGGNPQRNNLLALFIATGPSPSNPKNFTAIQTITCYGFVLTPDYDCVTQTFDTNYPPVPALITRTPKQ